MCDTLSINIQATTMKHNHVHVLKSMTTPLVWDSALYFAMEKKVAKSIIKFYQL